MKLTTSKCDDVVSKVANSQSSQEKILAARIVDL